MDGPTVSIITPTYNHEQFIRDCIESVIHQTYSNWEMIIVDDGSTDDTGSIVKGYLDDDRIEYIYQDNVGIWNLNESYNKALRRSSGEFVAILEGDDFWPETKLADQIAGFEDRDIVLSWGEIIRVDENGTVPAISQPYYASRRLLHGMKRRELLDSTDAVDRYLQQGCFNFAVTTMIRRAALEEVGGFRQAEYTPFVDYPTFLEVAKHGKVLYQPETLGYYRHHDEQVTKNEIEDLNTVQRYAREFYDGLEARMQGKLDTRRIDLEAGTDSDQASHLIGKGRVRLIDNEWKAAEDYFRRAIRAGPAFYQFVGLVGLLHSVCETDMEWIAKAIGEKWFE